MSKRVECLDGLRGLAALWVLVGHCMMLTGFRPPLFSQPDLGVDLFILLSGFLMVYQYQVTARRDDWGAPKTWVAFWLRRFFRLSPLYFVLLIIALGFGPLIHAHRVLIDNFNGVEPQSASRYLDFSATNLLLHATYLHGLLPSYAFRTPLPDWSLGLEMQFYAVFPLIVLTARRVGWLPAGILIGLVGIAAAIASRRLGLVYPMPAFLPLKMHMFVAGMSLAAALADERRRGLYLVVAVAFAMVPIGGAVDKLHLLIRALLVATFFGLVHVRRWRLFAWSNALLGSRPLFWLGELSFSIYLLHLLFLHPVAAFVIHQYGHTLAAPARFAIVFAATAALGYACAYLTYRYIERPGQALGKSVLERLGFRRRARQTDAELVAAP